jgi:rfaE bifunctional protein kinase chain/domain
MQELIKKIKMKGAKKIAFISGNFNIIHPGHQRLINFASDCADIVVIALNPDGAPDIYMPQELRLGSIKNISKVTHAFILEKSLVETLEIIRPDFVIKGKEHETRKNFEKNVIESYGGKILFSSGESFFSSKELMLTEMNLGNESFLYKEDCRDYLKRHKISFEKLEALVRRISTIKAVVIGDLIIDEYISCEPIGLSREEPVMVVTPTGSQKYVGGAGIVSGHLSSLGASVTYAGVVGEDHEKFFAVNFFKSNNISTCLIIDPTRPTTLKQKFRTAGRGLFRVNHLKSHEIDEKIVAELFCGIKKELDQADLLIFSDFNYGCLPDLLVNKITAYCEKKNIKMAADSQSSSQIGNVARFKNMMLITPTEHEARLACRDFSSGLITLVEVLKNASKAEHVLITLGQEGVIIHNPEHCINEIYTDQLKGLNANPKDVAGAGDSFLSCSSIALTLGANIFEAAYLGSVAAAIQVGRVGNIPLTQDELIEGIYR